MNSLWEQIGSAVHDARHGMAIDEATDRILALIAEAMLSTPAIDTHIEVSGDFRQDEFAGEYDAVEAGTKAQLAAAGITGAGQEGGEGE